MAISVTPIVLRLKEIRQERGLTQAELAEAAGVRQATISLLESDEVRRVDLDVLDRLATALRVKPGDLLKRDSGKR